MCALDLVFKSVVCAATFCLTWMTVVIWVTVGPPPLAMLPLVVLLTAGCALACIVSAGLVIAAVWRAVVAMASEIRG